MPDGSVLLTLPDAAAWREWLTANEHSKGVLLRLAKKGTTEPTSLTYDEALDEALVTAGSTVR